MWTDRQKDRQAGIKKLIVDFCNFENASRKVTHARFLCGLCTHELTKTRNGTKRTPLDISHNI